MADIAENLRTLFTGTTAIKERIGGRMSQDKVPTGYQRPFIYYERTAVRHERTLGDAQGEVPFSETFAIVCVADTPRDAEGLEDAVRTLDGGAGTGIDRLFIDEQDDDYEPVAEGLEAGRYMRILSAEVFP